MHSIRKAVWVLLSNSQSSQPMDWRWVSKEVALVEVLHGTLGMPKYMPSALPCVLKGLVCSLRVLLCVWSALLLPSRQQVL
jgi:hypothetical protein